MRFVIIPVTFFQQNCTLLICNKTDKAAIVDPGGDIDLILAAVDKAQVDVESILLTHGHLDHIGATRELMDKLQIPVQGPHVEDQFLIQNILTQSQRFGLPACESFIPTAWLNDGDIITVGENQLRVIHCPGHTPGHVVYYHAESNLALVGDVLFRGSIGRTDLPKGDFSTLTAAIKQKLWPLGKDVRFIPGHGPLSTFGEEMRSNPYVGI